MKLKCSSLCLSFLLITIYLGACIYQDSLENGKSCLRTLLGSQPVRKIWICNYIKFDLFYLWLCLCYLFFGLPLYTNFERITLLKRTIEIGESKAK